MLAAYPLRKWLKILSYHFILMSFRSYFGAICSSIDFPLVIFIFFSITISGPFFKLAVSIFYLNFSKRHDVFESKCLSAGNSN